MRHFESVEVTSRAEWRAWLDANYTRSESIWLVTYKKHCEQSVPYDAIVEEALCFGWIDSTGRRIDADRTALLLSPRRSGSIWSKLNKERIERLIADGRMAAPGRAAIEAAQADGSWTLYDECEALIVPPDLTAALAAVADATEKWHAFSPSSRKGILWWIKSARTPATRAKRLAETARLAGLGLRAQFPEARSAGKPDRS